MKSSCVQKGTKIAVLFVVSTRSIPVSLQPIGAPAISPCSCKYSGKMYGSVHYLDIIAPRFNDELLKKLLDIDDNLTVTLHMQTMDPVKAPAKAGNEESHLDNLLVAGVQIVKQL